MSEAADRGLSQRKKKMLRKNLILVLAAALMAVPVAAQASELSRRLTIRYPGQDHKKHRHHGEDRRDRRHEHRDHHDRPYDNRRGW